MTLRYRDVGLWGLAAWFILGRVSLALLAGVLNADLSGAERALVLASGAVALAGLLLGLFRSIAWATVSLAVLACLATIGWLVARPRPSGDLVIALICLGTILTLVVARRERHRLDT